MSSYGSTASHPAFGGPSTSATATNPTYPRARPLPTERSIASLSDLAKSPPPHGHNARGSASLFGRSLPTGSRGPNGLQGLGLAAGAVGAGGHAGGVGGAEGGHPGRGFTADTGDIREGTAQLGDLSLIRKAFNPSGAPSPLPGSQSDFALPPNGGQPDRRHSISDFAQHINQHSSTGGSATPSSSSSALRERSSPRAKPKELSGVSLAFANRQTKSPKMSSLGLSSHPPPAHRRGASHASEVIIEVESPEEREDHLKQAVEVEEASDGQPPHDEEEEAQMRLSQVASDGELTDDETERAALLGGNGPESRDGRKPSPKGKGERRTKADYGSVGYLSAGAPSEGGDIETGHGGSKKAHDLLASGEGLRSRARSVARRARTRVGEVTKEDLIYAAKEPVIRLPAVILGVLMNILDGVSYGLITFPTNMALFADFGGPGVSMFFMSCIASQVVYSTMSVFRGGNGSMMIEVVPFYHSIVSIIMNSVGEDKPDRVIATVMFSFAFSSIIVGIVFFALGWLKLGSLIGYFPRHILVGCIGGVGGFLFLTGLEVTGRLDGESFEWTLATLRHFMEVKMLPLWIIPLALGVAIKLITHRWTNPVIFPACFIIVPVVFYVVVAAAHLDINDLRKTGWIFDVRGVDTPWYEYFTYFNFGNTDIPALVETIPTQLALAFFALLHVPINLPALALSTGEDSLETNRELQAHGLSNALSGLLGSVPNYLVYSNSVLFYRVGGDSRLAGFMLAIADALILFAGPGVIGYLPVMIVGALIYILAIDLIKEAVWDTFGRVSAAEYATIWIIAIVMTVYDFVVGIGVGIVLACATFVVASSRRRAIRAILDGGIATSTVRRHPRQAAFLREVGSQTKIIKLQGFLFFGTIAECETTIRDLLEEAAWGQTPIRFLVLDFSLAGGVDFSAAEAFIRIQRLLEIKGVVMVICGAAPNSAIGRALRSVDLWTGNPHRKVEVFMSLNDSLEHCENSYLRSLYSKDFTPQASEDPPQATAIGITSSQPAILEGNDSAFEFAGSPRRKAVRQAASKTFSFSEAPKTSVNLAEPLPLLMQALGPFLLEVERDVDFYFKLVRYFERVEIPQGTKLWSEHDKADAFYVIETGMLRAVYHTTAIQQVVESMLPGTISGEMTFLSGLERNTRVTAERDTVLWRMDRAGYDRLLEKEDAELARDLSHILMRASADEYKVLITHLVTSS